MGAVTRGAAGEALAAIFFELRGASVLARNARLAGCEVDLLVRQGRTLALVEVKLRSRLDFGGAAAGVDARKRSRLIKAASALVARGEEDVRIDVVTIDMNPDGLQLTYYPNAVTGPA
jgi:putative endonuclease